MGGLLCYPQMRFNLCVLHVVQEKIMAMLTLRIDDELNARITALAQKTGRTKTYFIKKLLVEAIDDLEDELWAIAALKDLKTKQASGYKPSFISHEEMINELGFDVDLELRKGRPKNPIEVHPSDATRLIQNLERICLEGPNAPGLRGLKGEWTGKARLRVGKLRAILEFDDSSRTIFVLRVDYRGNVYD